MDSYKKLTNKILSFDLGTVSFEGKDFYCLRNMLYESYLNPHSQEWRNEAITDLLSLDDNVSKRQLVRLRSTIEQFKDSLNGHYDEHGLIMLIYQYTDSFNITLNIHESYKINSYPIECHNFANDLHDEIGTRLSIIDILYNGVFNAAHGLRFDGILEAYTNDHSGEKHLKPFLNNPVVLPEIPFELWDKNVYEVDDQAQGIKRDYIRHPGDSTRLKRRILGAKLEDILSEDYKGRSSTIIDLLATLDNPVINDAKTWIGPAYAGNALFNVLLGMGIINNVTKKTFAYAISKEFKNLNESFWTNKGGNDMETFERSFKLALSTLKNINC